MICKNCNKENIDGRKYCFYCGSELIEKKETVQIKIPVDETNEDSKQQSEIKIQPTKNKKSISGKIIALICVASIALISVSIAIIVSTVSKNSNVPVLVEQEDLESIGADSDSDLEASYIIMPNCEKKKYSTVKSQLEGMGLVVNESYEFSDEVEKDYVIYQMDAEGSQLQKGDAVSLTISKGSEKCPYEYEQKLTVTASSGSSYATAVLYEWQEGDWSKLATYDATVGSNGIGNTREGSSTSPKGIHKLGVVLSSGSVSTNMDTYTATSNTCVIDDTGSSYYNQIMEKGSVPSGTHYDNIGRGLTDGSTYATIYIEHNGSGFSSTNVVSGNGSAIGLRGQNGSLSPTYGDVDISASDMRDLLSKLDYNKNPVIELKTK